MLTRHELEVIAGSEGKVEGLAWGFLRRGIGNVLVTLGRESALLISPAGTLRQEAFPMSEVDTVGASDCFCGVFAAALTGDL